MQKLIYALPALIMGATQAAGTIDQLKIDDDVVLFSTTEAKTHTLPACVSDEHAKLWSVSLQTDSGKAMYALILNAMSQGSGLTVDSAADCANRNGVERAKGVDITVATQEAEKHTSLNIYKADGIKIGTLVSPVGPYRWYYSDSETTDGVKYMDNQSSATLYFASEDCSGNPHVGSAQAPSGKLVRNPFYNNNKFYTGGSSSIIDAESHLHSSSGECIIKSMRFSSYQLVEVEHPICGAHACVLKAN